MTYSNLLHFPIDRNPTSFDKAVPTTKRVDHLSPSTPQVIPFPGTAPQEIRQSKPSVSLSSIRVNTRLYRAFHAQSPKGIRSWGFAIGNFSETFWVQGLPFAIAAKQAQKEAQRLGSDTVIVLP